MTTVNQLLEGTDYSNENDLTDADLADDEILDGTEEEGEFDDLDSLEESALLTFAMAQESLTEQVNIVRLNKQSKLLNLTNRTAIILARKNSDSLYAKYAKANALRLQYRADIVKKYGTKAASYARKLMAKASTAVGAKK